MRIPSICLALSLSGTLAASGCASQLQTASAGHVGCPPQEIQIANKNIGYGVSSWQATCRGHEFQCSAASSTVRCTETLPPVPTAPAGAPAAAAPTQ
ncbi:MAG TPA: hypothetical protein VH877_04220 [Polyangia bacterium]|jgi:hypothetical protein|nr:hypothetical protein [Polyangia bacterium]